jgi:hypothetical protein
MAQPILRAMIEREPARRRHIRLAHKKASGDLEPSSRSWRPSAEESARARAGGRRARADLLSRHDSFHVLDGGRATRAVPPGASRSPRSRPVRVAGRRKINDTRSPGPHPRVRRGPAPSRAARRPTARGARQGPVPFRPSPSAPFLRPPRAVIREGAGGGFDVDECGIRPRRWPDPAELLPRAPRRIKSRRFPRARSRSRSACCGAPCRSRRARAGGSHRRHLGSPEVLGAIRATSSTSRSSQPSIAGPAFGGPGILRVRNARQSSRPRPSSPIPSCLRPRRRRPPS